MGWSWLGLQCCSLAPATWAALREGPGALREPRVPGEWGERAGEGQPGTLGLADANQHTWSGEITI